MGDKIKVLIVTDSAGLQTGLAHTTRNIFLPLLNQFPNKYELHQLGFFHWQPKEQVPWPIYQTRVNQTPQGPQPDGNDNYGQQSFHDIANKLKPDIVFGYGDMWHFNHLVTSPFRNQYRLITYYTIDGQPYFGSWLNDDGKTEWGSNLSKVDQLVVLSHFGKDTLRQSCIELKDTNIKVMYHPMDMNKYRYLDSNTKAQLKEKVLPKILPKDAFVIGWCGRNQFRKQNHKLWETLHYLVYGDYIECDDCERITIKEWNHSARRSKDPDKYSGDLEQLTIYDKSYRYDCCWYCRSKKVRNGIPNSNVYMWFHMPKKDPGYNCSLHERIWKVTNQSLYTDNVENAVGVHQDQLMMIMGAWDCMYYPSGGEGYGNPAAEAMALGIPIVYSDYSSHAEFCKFGGLPVRIGQYVPELMIGINRAVVDTGDAVKQFLKLIRNPKLRQELGVQGHLHMAQFNLPQMAKTWDSIFTDMYSKPLPIKNKVMYASSI